MVGVTLKKYVPDTSVLVDGRISVMLTSRELSKCEIIIPAPVIDELQAQASKNREPGFLGLQEVKKVREICEKEDTPQTPKREESSGPARRRGRGVLLSGPLANSLADEMQVGRACKVEAHPTDAHT